MPLNPPFHRNKQRVLNIMSGTKKTPMNTASAARIQSTQAKGGADVGKGSFSARAQSAAATNANKAASGAGGAAKKAPGAPSAKPSKK